MMIPSFPFLICHLVFPSLSEWECALLAQPYWREFSLSHLVWLLTVTLLLDESSYNHVISIPLALLR